MAGFETPAAARYVPDRTEAIQYALSIAGPDDCVLIAGRGHETIQRVADEQIALDDREVARRWLYNLQPVSPYGQLAGVANS
jgi:UDP-N-acetylmuramoyl-L-alanyl-D-glutamate--2,6-diaminopimelate ligase